MAKPPGNNGKNAMDKRIEEARAGPYAQDDPLRNPDGIYSGPSKRVAISDGTFAPVSGIPKDTRNRGKLKAE